MVRKCERVCTVRSKGNRECQVVITGLIAANRLTANFSAINYYRIASHGYCSWYIGNNVDNRG